MMKAEIDQEISYMPATDREERCVKASVAPLFILGVPRSYTSVVCAMLGQHPQMYGLPEMHLFCVETVGEWVENCERFPSRIEHGPLRAVAQLIYGEQTEQTVTLAHGWLRRRSHYTTGFLLEVLGSKIHPRVLVEKSPSIVRRADFLQRAYSMFPEAKFLHLVRHPRAQGMSVMNFIDRRSKSDHPPRWLINLASNQALSIRKYANWRRARLDPQLSWYKRNINICQFLETVPLEQQMRVRGEDLLVSPDGELVKIALWMGLRSDREAIEEMKHPERSPFACFGPKGAAAGGDQAFLENPVLRPARVEEQSLDGPLSWNADGLGFLPQVKTLARQFGYE